MFLVLTTATVWLVRGGRGVGPTVLMAGAIAVLLWATALWASRRAIHDVVLRRL